MALVVIAYPTIDPHDFAWLQTVRAEHDPLYSVVGPHFTFVFPTAEIDQAALIQHVRRQAHGIEKLPFVLRSAITVSDTLSDGTQVFLVPDEGRRPMVELHDALYTGLLAPQLRLDIPFVPHLTVASAPDPDQAQRIADALNATGIRIAGMLESLDVAWYEGTTVRTVARIDLGQAGRNRGSPQ